MTPIIVTSRSLEKMASVTELPALESAAGARDEQAQAYAMLARTLVKLRESEAESGSDRVMVTAQDEVVFVLQSAIAEGDIPPDRLRPLEAGGLEAMFDEQDWLGWATVAVAKLKNLHTHPLERPKNLEAATFPDEGRVGLLGDWGTGLYGAPVIARTIEQSRDPYAMLMHLGDVYYSGSNKEVKERFIDVWPQRAEAKMRALNSNHEMYSGGQAYFKATLPHFGQDASYFALQNKHWTLIGLDVAHKDHAINEKAFPNQQLDWLKGILAKSGSRKVIFFSHHQLFSHYESQGDKLWAEPAFAEILNAHRVFAWYWGHEHRCCIYEERDPRSQIWARCIGHGGMPQSRKKTRELPLVPEQEKAEWRRAPATDIAGNRVPSALILEGANPYCGDEADKFSPHGYANLIFEGPNLTEQVCDCTGNVIYENRLAHS